MLPREYYAEEVGSYAARMNRYGLPLDSRKTYTKSDWELWVATMAQSKEEFRRFHRARGRVSARNAFARALLGLV